MRLAPLIATAAFVGTATAVGSCAPNPCQSQLKAIKTHSNLCHSFTQTHRGPWAIPTKLSHCKHNVHSVSSACSCLAPATKKPTTTKKTTTKPTTSTCTSSHTSVTSYSQTTAKATLPNNSSKISATSLSTSTSVTMPSVSSSTQTTQSPSTTKTPPAVVTNVLRNGNFATYDSSSPGGIANWVVLGIAELVLGNGYQGGDSTDTGAVRLGSPTRKSKRSGRLNKRQDLSSPGGVEQYLVDLNIASDYTVNVWYLLDYDLPANSDPSGCQFDAYYGNTLIKSTGPFDSNHGQASSWTFLSLEFQPASPDGLLRLSLDCARGTAALLIDELFMSNQISPGPEEGFSMQFSLFPSTTGSSSTSGTITASSSVQPVSSSSSGSSSASITINSSSSVQSTTSSSSSPTSTVPADCRLFVDNTYWNPRQPQCYFLGDTLPTAPAPIFVMSSDEATDTVPCYDGNIAVLCANTCSAMDNCVIYSIDSSTQTCSIYNTDPSEVVTETDKGKVGWLAKHCFGVCNTNPAASCHVDVDASTSTSTTTPPTSSTTLSTTTLPDSTTPVSTASSTQTCDAVNPNSLVPNLSFEDVDDNGGNEASWTFDPGWTIDQSRAYDGSHSISTIASMRSTSFYQQISGLRVGQTYRMNFWYQYVVTPVEGNTMGDYCIFKAYLGSQALFYGILFNDYYKTSTWTQAWSYGAVPTSSTELLNCTFSCEATYGASSTAYIDQIVLGPEVEVPFEACPTSSTTAGPTTSTTSTSSTTSDSLSLPTECAWSRPDPSCSSLVPNPIQGTDLVCGVAGAGIGDVYEPNDPYYLTADDCAMGCALSETCRSYAWYVPSGVCQFSDSPFYWSTLNEHWVQGGNGELWYDNECFRCATAPEPSCSAILPTSTTTTSTATTMSSTLTPSAACATPTASLSEYMACGIPGDVASTFNVQSTDPIDNISLTDCAARCISYYPDCMSFSHDQITGTCAMFIYGTDYDQITYAPGSMVRSYDYNCFACPS